MPPSMSRWSMTSDINRLHSTDSAIVIPNPFLLGVLLLAISREIHIFKINKWTHLEMVQNSRHLTRRLYLALCFSYLLSSL